MDFMEDFGEDFEEEDFGGGFEGERLINLEHIEICFKPKKKYMKAFAELQSLFPLIKGNKLGFGNDCCFSCNNGRSEQSYLNSINLKTGELNLVSLINILGNKIDNKFIKSYIRDKDLREELMQALEECEDLKVLEELDCSAEYMHNKYYYTVEKIFLNEYMLAKDGTSHIFLNIRDLVNDVDCIGKVLGTFAEEITDVVYIDSKNYKDGIFVERDRKFEQLEFKFSTKQNELIIRDVRLPEEGINIYYTCNADDYEKYIRVKDVVIKLHNMDNEFHVEAEINIAKEYQPFIAKMMQIYKATLEAYEAGVILIKYPESTSNAFELYCTKLLFNILDYDYNICKQAVDEYSLFGNIIRGNRNYKLREAFKNIEDNALYEILTGEEDKQLAENNKFEENEIMKTDIMTSIHNIKMNQVDAEGKQWRFKADFSCIFEKNLRKYFNNILQNIGSNEDPGILDIKRLQ